MTTLTEVRERPIPFTKEMIEAILAGRKSQTRRVMKVQPDLEFQQYPTIPWIVDGEQQYTDSGLTLFISDYREGMTQSYTCPYGKVGDRLYVKTHRFLKKIDTPAWLEITDIRVERLQDITEQDAITEGIAHNWIGQDCPPEYEDEYMNYGGDEDDFPCFSARESFQTLWQSINSERPGCSWQDNPFVWVVGFKRIEVK